MNENNKIYLFLFSDSKIGETVVNANIDLANGELNLYMGETDDFAVMDWLTKNVTASSDRWKLLDPNDMSSKPYLNETISLSISEDLTNIDPEQELYLMFSKLKIAEHRCSFYDHSTKENLKHKVKIIFEKVDRIKNIN